MEEVKGKMEDCHTDSELLTQFHKNTPQLRFSGFDDEWEEKKLGEIVTEVKRKADSNSTAPVMMISATQGFINQSEKYSADNAGSSLKNYTLLKKGELSYNHGYSKTRNFGSCFTLEIDEARIPFVYHSFSLDSDDSSFFGKYLNSGLFDKELKKRVASTARMDGLLNISFDEYVSLIIKKPTLAEQQKIGTFLSHVDSLIQAKTKKLESLKAVKKSLLQKCFPKAGEKVPEMRFAGFSGDWEEKKLGEIADFLDNQRIPIENSERKTGNYPYYGASGIIDYVDDYIFDGNYVLLGEDGANIVNRSSRLAFVVSGKCWINNHAHVLKPKANTDLYFLSECLENQDYEIYNSGTAQPKLNQEVCFNIKLQIPISKPEQQKIGQFFSKYDSLISAQQKEIDRLKEVKKALLQKMFI